MYLLLFYFFQVADLEIDWLRNRFSFLLFRLD